MKTICAIVLTACFIVIAATTANAEISVSRAAVCTSIEEREPVGAAESFEVAIEKLYLFAEIIDAGENTPIKHIWYHGDKNVLEVEMTVSGPRWRTSSHKNIYETMTGKWRAEIVDASGKVLKSVAFEVK